MMFLSDLLSFFCQTEDTAILWKLVMTAASEVISGDVVWAL